MKNRLVCLVAVSLLSAALAGCSDSHDASVPADQAADHAMERAVKTAIQRFGGESIVHETFAGPGGLIGLSISVGHRQARRELFWASPDGSLLIDGRITDGNGHNPTLSIARARDIEPGPTTSVQNADGSIDAREGAKAELAALVLASSGSGPRELWVFADPACPSCRNAHEFMQDPVVEGALTVHWVGSTAVGGDRSAQLIAQTLEGKISFGEFINAGTAGASAAEVGDAAQQYVEASSSALHELARMQAVPTVLFEQGGQWFARTGFDPLAYLPEELKLPALNRRLARYQPGAAGN